MGMDDRVVLLGGPFNDECVLLDDVANTVVINVVDDNDRIHVYSLNVDLASAAIYDYVGMQKGGSPTEGVAWFSVNGELPCTMPSPEEPT